MLLMNYNLFAIRVLPAGPAQYLEDQAEPDVQVRCECRGLPPSQL